MKWAYGVTTVSERVTTLLPQSLRSLAQAGFGEPRIFLDNDSGSHLVNGNAYHSTTRNPRVRSYGNWLLALAELVIREPQVDRYAIFQDDLVTYKNLRGYLEQCKYPRDGYWNLYTFPQNQAKAPVDPTGQSSQAQGWYLSDQRGKGAVALVFSNDVAYKMLYSAHTWTRLRDPHRGWQAIDGGVVTALGHQGIKEYVHNPSLVQHMGDVSSMGHGPYPKAMSFKGESFDALSLLPKYTPTR